ncbi:MAG: Ig-like domain-containing protein [Myxococcales bacterium]|nr:Ig-like domain-containing protein [Myxococcales bacterium]
MLRHATRMGCLATYTTVLVLCKALAAHASCPATEPRVLWSHPGSGATDVPTDADLLLFTDSGRPGTVMLNGVSLDPTPGLPEAYDLGALSADTEYTVTVELTRWDGSAAATESWSFVTASEDATPSVRPEVRVLQMEEETCSDWTCGFAGLCKTLAFANSCFDTGFPTLQRAIVQGSAVAWIYEERTGDGRIARTLVPAKCGDPSVLTWAPDDDDRSYRVLAVGADGSVSESEAFEGPFTRPPDRHDGGADCTLAAGNRTGAPAWNSLLAVGLLVVRRRRARSRRCSSVSLAARSPGSRR